MPKTKQTSENVSSGSTQNQTGDENFILDRYKVLKELASTRFSTVYKAFDTKMQRLVAIKMIESTSKATTWAKREAQLSAQLNHPNICTIYEYEETPKAHLLIMEYLEGLTLREILDSCGVLSLDEVMSITKEVSKALEYAHINYIIHQDIKPENILLLKDGRLKIMDFGTGRLLGHVKEAQKSLVGTPAYMSPEQTKKEHLDDRTDQFSLAVVVYEMLSGASPFEAATTQAAIFKVQNTKAQSLAKLNDEVDDEFAAATEKALSKKADNRYETVTDLRYKLERSHPTPASTKRVLSELISHCYEDEEQHLAEGSSIFDVIRSANERIYTKNRLLINRLFAAASTATLGFILFSTVGASYSLFVFIGLGAFALVLPSLSIVALTIVASVALFLQSLPIGAFVVLAAGSTWYIFFNKKLYIEICFSFLAASLAYIKFHLLFPIFTGLAFSPIKAFLVSCLGAAQVLVFSAIWQQRLISFDSAELSQLLAWPVVSFIVSVITKKRTFSSAVAASLMAFVVLAAVYIAFALPHQGQFELALKSLSLSLIITMVVLPLIPFEKDVSR